MQHHKYSTDQVQHKQLHFNTSYINTNIVK